MGLTSAFILPTGSTEDMKYGVRFAVFPEGGKFAVVPALGVVVGEPVDRSNFPGKFEIDPNRVWGPYLSHGPPYGVMTKQVRSDGQ